MSQVISIASRRAPHARPAIEAEPVAAFEVLPGMIDLHCDALEKEVEPRPNVHFPLDFACAQADKRNAAAGITTVYHALSFANAELGVRNNAFAAEVAHAVHAWQAHALVDNRVHARYEVTDPTAPAMLAELLECDELHLLSFMDHTPGQGQFKNIGAYRDFLARTYKKDAAEVDAILDAKRAAGLADRGEIAPGKRADLIAVKTLGGLPQLERVWVRGAHAFSAHFDHA
jgi:alpha-D-ribose 1-methylphosphonate 5-triphosphate diphosphatase